MSDEDACEEVVVGAEVTVNPPLEDLPKEADRLKEALTHKRSWHPNGRDVAPVGIEERVVLNPRDALTQRRLLHPNGREVLDRLVCVV